MQRLGDERAQRVFERHRRMLTDTLAASGGEELQWLGDGQMAAFASPADAVRCAVAMQQGAVRPIDGERLRVRVGLNVGEIMRGAGGGYFGTPVVTARRLCDARRPHSGCIPLNPLARLGSSGVPSRVGCKPRAAPMSSPSEHHRVAGA